ncbi:hypothetical protein IE81DRAFT_110471 [Ceraceosorus guamensis]|uniref:Uncharacterized protein n=1 Tax=Ceraceosorus guamensis TaxID=1522189 RepID=A0A316VYY9_9BASI|nr:hypothetical protein IE81DRAFT_110471 [Ceraceosorus guamensis]PWN42856.1 hypothetical protein IE81DRAFT_110471 [Ceraceosorus guamensis]
MPSAADSPHCETQAPESRRKQLPVRCGNSAGKRHALGSTCWPACMTDVHAMLISLPGYSACSEPFSAQPRALGQSPAKLQAIRDSHVQILSVVVVKSSWRRGTMSVPTWVDGGVHELHSVHSGKQMKKHRTRGGPFSLSHDGGRCRCMRCAPGAASPEKRYFAMLRCSHYAGPSSARHNLLGRLFRVLYRCNACVDPSRAATRDASREDDSSVHSTMASLFLCEKDPQIIPPLCASRQLETGADAEPNVSAGVAGRRSCQVASPRGMCCFDCAIKAQIPEAILSSTHATSRFLSDHHRNGTRFCRKVFLQTPRTQHAR